MEIDPLISVIVPIYKVEQYLHKCVDSIISQTYTNLEIILVDDGSPDNCGKLCDEYADKDSRIKVIHKENGGLVSARNAGYEIATGDWIMYLDGDDWIDINTFEELVSYISKYEDIDVVFWKYIQELDNKSIKGKLEWPCEEDLHLYTNDECKELSRNTLIYKSGIATAYCKLLRRNYVQKYDVRHCPKLRQGLEGVEFSLRAFYNAQKVLYVNKYYNHYRYNANSISKTVDEKNVHYIIDCVNVIEKGIVNFSKYENFKIALQQRCLYVLLAAAMSTYFHPSNKDSYKVKKKKFSTIIEENKCFSDAIKSKKFSFFDKFRLITIYIIKLKCYFLLPFIARLKLFMLRYGQYGY
ncbi:hypothetical protein FACS189432_02410 [Bacteroidia bacterium]|nr:hypothetical protein FACS189426_00470 [Bacteroidia bacterium]GHT26955.1 hypothetical protein FACS189432_02410 [Bacteroidia bacterium]